MSERQFHVPWVSRQLELNHLPSPAKKFQAEERSIDDEKGVT
jgi:hypothetical protein